MVIITSRLYSISSQVMVDSSNQMPKDIRFLCEWNHDFDKLLSDRKAIKLFAQFLKKEYSYENLKFWLSCNKYKRIKDKQKRLEYSRYVYDKYLRPGAEQAVNVDNEALTAVESQLKEPKHDLFDVPERQIYQLMKTDCYKRFLTSFYANGNNENVFHEKIFQQMSGNQNFRNERYRKNAYRKLRRQELHEINRRIARNSNKLVRNVTPNKSLINGQKYDRIDTSLRSDGECHPLKSGRMQMESMQWIQSNMSSNQKHKKDNSFFSESKHNSLIIVFPNGSQERLEVHKSETIRQLLETTLKKRNLNYTSFEAFLMDSEEKLDLNTDAMSLSGAIRVEQRVVFDIQLPNGLIVNVKSKPSTISAKVINPILLEFNHKFDPEYYEIRFTDSWDRLAPDMPIFLADNRKLVVIFDGTNESKSIVETSCATVEREKMFLKQFLVNETKSNDTNVKNKDFINISDMSLGDGRKSEEFFNDLMKCSQSVPKDLNQSTNQLKSDSKNSKNYSKSENFLENMMFLSENSIENTNPKKSNQKTKIKINSPKHKSIKKSPIIKSDQLYDKRIVDRSNKIAEQVNRLNASAKCRTDQTMRSTDRTLTSSSAVQSSSIRTLSKFHKTSSDGLHSTTNTNMKTTRAQPFFVDRNPFK